MEMPIKEYIKKNYISRSEVIRVLEESIKYYENQIKEWMKPHKDLSGAFIISQMNHCEYTIKELKYLIEIFKEVTNETVI